MQNQDTDDRLIQLAATGDRAAFEALVDRHAPALFRLARAMTTSEAAAADVVQEALISAFTSASTYRPDRSGVRAWLFTIARNKAKRARRSSREAPVDTNENQWSESSLVELGVEAGWGAEEATESLQQREALIRALASLSAEDSEILLLRDIEGLSGEQAAEVLGIGLTAMKSRLHRARLKLLAAMRESEGGVVENQRDHGGLSCSEVLSRLGDYVDGDLDTQERARVDEHLRGCSVCERFGGRYANTVHSARVKLGVAPAIEEEQLARIRRALG